jgi:hypothetical protein
MGREMGQDSEGFGFDDGAHPEGLAKEGGSVGLAAFTFGDDFGNKHAYILLLFYSYVKEGVTKSKARNSNFIEDFAGSRFA